MHCTRSLHALSEYYEAFIGVIFVHSDTRKALMKQSENKTATYSVVRAVGIEFRVESDSGNTSAIRPTTSLTGESARKFQKTGSDEEFERGKSGCLRTDANVGRSSMRLETNMPPSSKKIMSP